MATTSINTTALTQNILDLAVIFQTVSIGMGLGLFLMGLFRLKRYGEQRTFMSYQMTIARPLFMLLGGALLVYLPVTLSSALYNFWSTSSPLAYQPSSYSGYQMLIPPVIMFVRLIGVGAFIKGILLLSRCGGEQTQPGTMGKSLLYIFGGILCVNIMATINLMKTFFGVT